MGEVDTIRIHHGYCPHCAEPVRLRWFLTDDNSLRDPDKEGYWKVIEHGFCKGNGRKSRPVKGAKEAFRMKALNIRAATIVSKRWPPKPIPPDQRAAQLSLFW
ncbi:MAG: hypothetical protein PHZ04_00705 [Patescibacteria group bacterium]|nr:hypothetical protein [Patescibacteria group bacterium]MDD5294536.1 hypothetical protein [Patescibacteria group bacterium]MDD5554717.1 hypothetical protein [Patescibacteria group bacterium]